jgi:hypothetical protein
VLNLQLLQLVFRRRRVGSAPGSPVAGSSSLAEHFCEIAARGWQEKSSGTERIISLSSQRSIASSDILVLEVV